MFVVWQRCHDIDSFPDFVILIAVRTYPFGQDLFFHVWIEHHDSHDWFPFPPFPLFPLTLTIPLSATVGGVATPAAPASHHPPRRI